MSKTLRPPINKAWCCANRDERKHLIVETALDLLDKQGECAVTMRAIASTLGVGTMTLYTYVRSLEDLHHLMTRRGFEKLNEGCKSASTLESQNSWRGGAQNYLKFALENPNLYNFMFSTPVSNRPEDAKLAEGSFQVLLDKVRNRLDHSGTPSSQLDKKARMAAGRFWVALHGMATLAIAGRTNIITPDTTELLEEILKQNSPD
jgi:AcrR family transcriptional regulator